MKNYLDMVEYVLNNGIETSDRTGIGTISHFGTQTRYNLQNGFPIMTTKKINFASVVSELLWFLEGSTDERRLAELRYKKPRHDIIGKKTIWTDNADNQGKKLGYVNTDLIKELGPVYGKQWRSWNGKDQLKDLIQQIKKTPDSRRLILSAWNYEEIENMALPPCHTLLQFKVYNNKLNCQLYQRSADVFLRSAF